MDHLNSLQGSQVRVVYNGVVYKGKLVGTGEDEIHLQTESSFVTLPMANITDLQEATEEGI